jgi:hypothetical protein
MQPRFMEREQHSARLEPLATRLLANPSPQNLSWLSRLLENACPLSYAWLSSVPGWTRAPLDSAAVVPGVQQPHWYAVPHAEFSQFARAPRVDMTCRLA